VLLSADFWPVFWTIVGSGAMLTVALCFVVAIVPSPRIGRRHEPPAKLHGHRVKPRPADLPRAA
jgi:hypothetical protein